MLVSEARIPTASASKYLQQLCKHWSHKFQVEFTPEKRARPVCCRSSVRPRGHAGHAHPSRAGGR